MLLSIALIILVSLVLTSLFQKINIPGIVAMILTGIILGPYVFDLISPQILDLSADLRQIALIVILLRAGLTVDIKDLKKVGRPALLLSFVPATVEIIVIAFLGPILFDISLIESLIMGSVVAAASPAVVVPRMIHLIETQRGTQKSIPQMILAGASLDDIYVIILFTSFVQIYQTNQNSFSAMLQLPISIILGIVLGISSGFILVKIFKKLHIRDTVKIFIIFGVAFMMVYLETILKPYVSVSGLLSIMVLGGTILKLYPQLSTRLTTKFSKIWVGAEIMLFVLVGAILDITVLKNVGLFAVILIVTSLLFRMIAVFFICSKTGLTFKEKLFISFSYLPKATVQAAIGAIPLSLGIPAGGIILAVAVLSILISAPVGAVLIDVTAKKYLQKQIETI